MPRPPKSKKPDAPPKSQNPDAPSLELPEPPENKGESFIENLFKNYFNIVVLFMISIYILLFTLMHFTQKYNVDNINSSLNDPNLKCDEYTQIINEIQENTKKRVYLFGGIAFILFIFFVIHKYYSDPSEFYAIIALMFLGLTSKLIEYIGLKDCFGQLPTNMGPLNPKAQPGKVLLFDMFYSNTFAYFIDFLFAFAMVAAADPLIPIKDQSDTFIQIINNNMGISISNIFRFLIYILIIIVTWNLGTILRPKIAILYYKFFGIPLKNINDISSKNIKFVSGSCTDVSSSPDPTVDPPDSTPSPNSLVTTNSLIGILAAATAEGLIFKTVLFPMRQHFIYYITDEDNDKYNKYKILGLVAILVGVSLGIIFGKDLIVKLGADDVDKKTEDLLSEKPPTTECDSTNMVPQIIFILMTLIFISIIIYQLRPNYYNKFNWFMYLINMMISCLIIIVIYQFNGINNPYNILNPTRDNIDGITSLMATAGSIIFSFVLLLFYKDTIRTYGVDKINITASDKINITASDGLASDGLARNLFI